MRPAFQLPGRLGEPPLTLATGAQVTGGQEEPPHPPTGSSSAGRGSRPSHCCWQISPEGPGVDSASPESILTQLSSFALFLQDVTPERGAWGAQVS